jgi:hypothetical protein
MFLKAGTWSQKRWLLQRHINIQRADEIMETRGNLGIKFVLATMKELQSATLNVLPFVYIL